MAYNNFPYTDLNSINLDWIIKKCKEAFSREIPTKTSQLENDSGFGTYTKPEGGIPETDLTDRLQKLLNSLAANEYKPYPVSFSTGSPATFYDGADDIPIKDLTVTVEAIQSGSGDPAPDNIRPISGWTAANVTRSGKNLIRLPEAGTTMTSLGITYTYQADGSVRVVGTSTGNSASNITNLIGRNVKIHAGYASAFLSDVDTGVRLQVRRGSSGGAEYFTTGVSTSAIGSYGSDDTYVIRLNVPSGTTVNATIYPMLIEGSQPLSLADFIPYQSKTYSIIFPSSAGTVYGGTLDVTTGKLTVTHGQIASYAGETLPGEWISDRDVYTPGTTPTLGAQVVYVLDTPISYDLSPTEMKTTLGTNNILADCGTSTVHYRADITLYIDRQINP